MAQAWRKQVAAAPWCHRLGLTSLLFFWVLLLNLIGYQPHGSLSIGSFGLGFCSVPQTPSHPKGSGILFKPCMDSEPSAFCQAKLSSESVEGQACLLEIAERSRSRSSSLNPYRNRERGVQSRRSKTVSSSIESLLKAILMGFPERFTPKPVSRFGHFRPLHQSCVETDDSLQQLSSEVQLARAQLENRFNENKSLLSQNQNIMSAIQFWLLRFGKP